MTTPTPTTAELDEIEVCSKQGWNFGPAIVLPLLAMARRTAEAEEAAHYANGVADLALKHRDEAEAERDQVKTDGLRRFRVVNEAYGLLWQIETDDTRIHRARKLLLSMIDRDEQSDGISKTKPMNCGHPVALAVNSAETDEFLYCELCDARSGRQDAEKMEAFHSVRADTAEAETARLREQVATARRDALEEAAKVAEADRRSQLAREVGFKPEFARVQSMIASDIRALAATSTEEVGR